MAEWSSHPESVKNTEDFAKWLREKGVGKAIDLHGHTFRPKGGYEKDVYGLVWHEHPHPHWYMEFSSNGTKVKNGTIVVNPRLALVVEGGDVEFEGLTFEGLGTPGEDERNALLIQGRAASIKMTNCTFVNMSVYIWEGAHATICDCTFEGGLHGVYPWGKANLTMERCTIRNMEQSGINVNGHSEAVIKDTVSTGAKVGSGLWAGEGCQVTVEGGEFSGNESYGIEANHAFCKVTHKGCKLTDNGKGESDSWDGATCSAAA